MKSFVEKPNAEDALACIEAGDCYWNSGMFVFGASRYLRELASHAPSICEAVGSAHENMVSDLGFLRLNPESFTESPSTSVDYAVMEHTSDAAVVPLDAGWSDVGSWAGLAGLAERDAAGNTAQGDVILQEVRDTYVHGQDRLVAVVGAEDLVIVDTADAVLVAGRSAAHDVKKVVERLKDTGRDEYRNGRKVYRPWGSYDSVYERGGFLVKHITVNPGQRLSLQMHRHRAEHWIVVRGTARVTRGNEIFMLSENESTYIPRGVKHRLENPDAAPLELVEVQTGSYLGEDDIIRFEDAYGRGDGPSTRVRTRFSRRLGMTSERSASVQEQLLILFDGVLGVEERRPFPQHLARGGARPGCGPSRPIVLPGPPRVRALHISLAPVFRAARSRSRC